MSELTKNLNNIKLDRQLFVQATDAEKASVEIMRPTSTYWQDAWKRLRQNKMALTSLTIIVIMILGSIVIPMISPYGFEQIIKDEVQQGPSLKHLFGTDNLGRDILVRCMIGTRISLVIGFISAFFVTIIGVSFGAISGYFGGWIDSFMMRFVDVVYSVPTTLIAIILQVVLDAPMDRWFTNNPKMGALQDLGGVFSIIIVLILLYWVDMARIVRGQVLALKQQEYILAAKALGASSKNIITRHLIPNCMGEIIVTAAFKVPQAIFFEAFLSFISIGVKPPMASLGSLVNSGIRSIYTYPLDLLFPAILISLIILAFNLLGDGLRDALDPRLKQ